MDTQEHNSQQLFFVSSLLKLIFTKSEHFSGNTVAFTTGTTTKNSFLCLTWWYSNYFSSSSSSFVALPENGSPIAINKSKKQEGEKSTVVSICPTLFFLFSFWFFSYGLTNSPISISPFTNNSSLQTRKKAKEDISKENQLYIK